MNDYVNYVLRPSASNCGIWSRMQPPIRRLSSPYPYMCKLYIWGRACNYLPVRWGFNTLPCIYVCVCVYYAILYYDNFRMTARGCWRLFWYLWCAAHCAMYLITFLHLAQSELYSSPICIYVYTNIYIYAL